MLVLRGWRLCDVAGLVSGVVLAGLAWRGWRWGWRGGASVVGLV